MTSLQTSSSEMSSKSMPTVILVVGMAGTGKTTLVHRLQHYAAGQSISTYYINLDPAVSQIPYNVNIDIRDTVNYKEVMSTYRLGPNGAIMTSLNLFATKIHQLIELLEHKEDLEWIIVDTPGQIEVFTWSASGQLITEAFSAVFPTIVLFVADTTRCVNPQTFISTMLYSSGIMLKQQLPLVLVFNKIDVTAADMIVNWMRNSDNLEDAMATMESNKILHINNTGSLTRNTTTELIATKSDINENEEAIEFDTSKFNTIAPAGKEHIRNTEFSGLHDVHEESNEVGYAGTLVRSMSLFLHEFYEDIPFAAVSAASGVGMSDLTSAITRARVQFISERSETNAALEKASCDETSDSLNENQFCLNSSNDNDGNEEGNDHNSDTKKKIELQKSRASRELKQFREDVQTSKLEEYYEQEQNQECQK